MPNISIRSHAIIDYEIGVLLILLSFVIQYLDNPDEDELAEHLPHAMKGPTYARRSHH